MKPLKFKLIAFLALSLCVGTLVSAQSKLSKDLKKEYQVTSSASLVLDNRYGSINIKDWDRNIVSIEVVISVENPRQETAQRYLDYINVEFSESDGVITARTTIDERYGRAGTRTIVFNDENKLSIDYTVNMPRNLKVSISQRYGDVFINELSGEMSLNVRYGNLTVNKLTRGNVSPLAAINLAYSKGSVAEAGWLNLDLKYSEIKIDKAQALVIVSKYSRINVDRSSSVVANSRYDRYALGTLNNFVINGGYTNVNVETVRNRIEIESRYGGVRIDNVPAGFGRISITSSYTNVTVGIASAASYQLTGKVAYGNIRYPSTGRVNRTAGSTETNVNGFVGSDEKTASEVVVNARYGNVNLVR